MCKASGKRFDFHLQPLMWLDTWRRFIQQIFLRLLRFFLLDETNDRCGHLVNRQTNEKKRKKQIQWPAAGKRRRRRPRRTLSFRFRWETTSGRCWFHIYYTFLLCPISFIIFFIFFFPPKFISSWRSGENATPPMMMMRWSIVNQPYKTPGKLCVFK